MASNKKISELTEFTAAQLADDDLIVMVDVSDSTTKKVAASTFRATVSGVESLTAVAPLSVDAPSGDVTIQITDPLPIANGGTAATTASVARTNLGLGTIATQNSNSVSITGGVISGITDLAIADGGTGASTAADARTNLGVTASGSDTTYAYRANNLSDLVSASVARTNLGLGTIATQDASNVSITGGAISGITDLAVADGGTGASNAAAARTNLGAAASGANSDITSLTGLTTALSVPQGGTGATTASAAATALGVGTGNSPTFAGLNIDTASGVDGQWNTSGLTVYANGVTPQHDGPLHVMSGSAGTVTASTAADELIVEGPGNAAGGLSILNADANDCNIFFGCPSDNLAAMFQWNYTAKLLAMSTRTTGGYLKFGVEDEGYRGEWNTTGLTCFASGVTPQHDGVLHVMSGSAGTVTASTDSDELIVESGGAGGLSILTPAANYGIISFGSPTSNQQAKVYWNDSGSLMQVGTLKTGASLQLVTGNNQVAAEITAAGSTFYASGVTPQHDGVLHVMKGSAGTVTSTSALTVESDGSSDAISILTPDATAGYIIWASPSDATGAFISFKYSTAKMQLATDLIGGAIDFRSGNNVLALTLDSSARMVALNTYSTTVGATNRDLYIDSTGIIGYVSSLRAAKTEIDPITDTSWLHALTPVSFKYRKKAEDGKSYTNEIDGDIQYGMIAEDVAAVRPDLCFYDDVADLDENGEKTETTHKELRGIQYSKLIPVLLKEVQKLRAELNQMKVN